MSLINTDDAINCVNEQMNDLEELMHMYEILLKKLTEVNEHVNTKKALFDAGFTEDQINTFIGIVMRTDNPK